jgi:molybdopterin-containing oxidoreductase family iron-sulfur binding subunit
MSKRKWQHPEIPAGESTTKVWRSAGELEDTSGLRQWLEREFPRAAESMIDENDRESSRRDFLKVMGASTALAGFGLAACRRPEELIVPYVNAPEWVIPGKPLYYASSIPTAGGAVPTVVTNYQGRPTKLEPNGVHPSNDGQSAFDQASVLDLYNPARSRDFLNKGKKISRATAEKQLAELTQSGKVGFVFGEDDSATRTRLRADLAKKFSGAQFYSYEALAGHGRSESNQAIFGDGAQVVADYTDAKRILSVDADFLELDKQGPVKGFYDRRHVNGRDYKQKDATKTQGEMNRLYIAEPTYSVTGGMADHRAPLAPSQVGRFLAQLANELGVAVTVPGGNFGGKKDKWIKECAKDLAKHRGQSVVLLGSRYDKELHDLAHLINQKLGSYGKTLKAVQTEKKGLGSAKQLVKDIEASKLDTVILLTPANPVYESEVLKGALAKVKTVQLGLRTDATAHAADLHVPAAHYLESWSDSYTSTGVYTIVQPMILALYGGVSELELLLGLIDGKLHDSKSNATSPAYTAVRATFDTQISKAAGAKAKQAAWMKLLREGFFKSEYAAASGSAPAVPALKAQAEPTAQKLDIIYATDGSVLDGRYIDNAWLQEAPDPITKVCWDNAIYLSPETAKAVGVYEELVELEKKGAAWWASLGFDDRDLKKSDVPEEGEGPSLFAPVAKITINGKTLEAPVIVSFGMADNVISIPLGYGQGYDEHWSEDFKSGDYAYSTDTACDVSSVGVNTGFNAYPLRGASDYFAQGATIARAESGSRYKMARTQEHHSMYGRALAREISTAEDKTYHKDYAAQLKTVQKQGIDSHMPKNMSLYKQDANGGPITTGVLGREKKAHLSDESQQWAMTIDLNVCNGCNACLVACQAENNIPVVGKNQVAMGREMHWIRMDRYFAAPDNDQYAKDADSWEKSPEMIPQPVACVQCESAPCETVCPVNATVHSEDGLNTMAYNRCIGTRYCANNCPYKARRFNFFDYNKRNPLLHKNLYKGPAGETQVGDAKSLQRNPNVSVRMRGVMEKCTYCVQRLQSAKIEAKKVAKTKAVAAAGGSTTAEITAKQLMPKTDGVRVACQEVCGAGAIVFGNLKDPNSMIRRIKNENNKITNERAYDLLNYIGTKPRTSYLARVKNPNTAMPGAKYVGKATVHMH